MIMNELMTRTWTFLFALVAWFLFVFFFISKDAWRGFWGEIANTHASNAVDIIVVQLANYST